jgi:hypothetical protein
VSVKRLEEWAQKNPGARVAIVSEVIRGIVYWQLIMMTADGEIIKGKASLYIWYAAELAIAQLSQVDREDNRVNPYANIFVEEHA